MGFRKKKKLTLTACLKESFSLTEEDEDFREVVKLLCKKRKQKQGYKKLSKIIAIKITNGQIKRINEYFQNIVDEKTKMILRLQDENILLEDRIADLENQVNSEVDHLCKVFKPKLTTYEVLLSIKQGCNDFRLLRNINRLKHNEAKYIIKALTEVRLVDKQDDGIYLTDKGVRYIKHYKRTDDVYLAEAKKIIEDWSAVLGHLSNDRKTKFKHYTYTELTQRTQEVLNNLSGRVASKKQFKSFSKAYSDISKLLNNVNDCLALKYNNGQHKKNYNKNIIFVKGLIKNLENVSQVN